MQSLFSACISLRDLMIAYVGISLFDDNPFCLFESPILTIFCCVTVHRFNKKKSEAKAAQFVNVFHLGCLTSLKGIFAGFYRLNF